MNSITLAVAAYRDDWKELRFQENECFMKLNMLVIEKQYETHEHEDENEEIQRTLNQALLNKYESYPSWNDEKHSTSLPLPKQKMFYLKGNHGYIRQVFINNGDPFKIKIGELFYAGGLMRSRDHYVDFQPFGLEKYNNLPHQSDDLNYSNDSDSLYLYIWNHANNPITEEEEKIWSKTYSIYGGNMYLYKFLPFYDETQTPYPKTQKFKKENRFSCKLQIVKINFNEITELKYNCIYDDMHPHPADMHRNDCDCPTCMPMSDVCTVDKCHICPMIDDCKNNKCHRYQHAQHVGPRYCWVCNRDWKKESQMDN